MPNNGSMHLNRKQKQILIGMAQGRVLKAHRDINGKKTVRLHHADDHEQFDVVPRPFVDGLKDAGLIKSNKKFPAATYFLTEAGRQAAEALTGEAVRTVGPIRFLTRLFESDDGKPE